MEVVNDEVKVNSNPFLYQYDLLGGGLSSQLSRTFSLVLSVGNEFSAIIAPELDTATITITGVSGKLHRNPQPGLLHHPLDAKDMCSLKFLGHAERGFFFTERGSIFYQIEVGSICAIIIVHYSCKSNWGYPLSNPTASSEIWLLCRQMSIFFL